MKQLTIGSIFAALLALSGCGNGEVACVTSDDCFKGEMCIEDVCQSGASVDVQNSSINSSSSNAGSNGNANSSSTNGASNNGSANVSSGGVCVVDPFTSMCPTDENDSSSQYITTETGRGCLRGGDDFEGGEHTELGLIMCALESVDRYSTNLIPCDNVTFVVEVTVTPRENCDPDGWDLNVSLQTNDCVEPNGKVRCETLDDGSKRVTAFLEPSNSVTSPYIDVTTVRENVQFEYDVKIVVRE